MSTAPLQDGGAGAVLSEQDVCAALDAGQFVLHFQPLVDLDSGDACGVEALIRWEHPVGGLLAPDDFLPAVAQTPVMTNITCWVLETACAAAARWPGWTMSVNVTARDLAGDILTRDVLAALERADVAPNRLVLELTETALVQDMERAATTLTELRDHGIGVALDDFGTGYSSMLYLRDLPVSSVKIDRLFVSGLTRDKDDRAIVTSLLTLARTVGLTAVAEGVENDTQFRQLHALGCPVGQGYLWSRPAPAAAIDEIHSNGLVAAGRARTRKKGRPRAAADKVLVTRAHELLARGASLHTIAAALNAAGERTENGSRWHAATVARLINSKNPGAPKIDQRQ